MEIIGRRRLVAFRLVAEDRGAPAAVEPVGRILLQRHTSHVYTTLFCQGLGPQKGAQLSEF